MCNVMLADNEREIVRLENACKVCQMGTEEVHAFHGVKIGSEKGDFRAIMGPSGSGKNAMMNVLGCLDRLTITKEGLWQEFSPGELKNGI